MYYVKRWLLEDCGLKLVRWTVLFMQWNIMNLTVLLAQPGPGKKQ